MNNEYPIIGFVRRLCRARLHLHSILVTIVFSVCCGFRLVVRYVTIKPTLFLFRVKRVGYVTKRDSFVTKLLSHMLLEHVVTYFIIYFYKFIFFINLYFLYICATCCYISYSEVFVTLLRGRPVGGMFNKYIFFSVLSSFPESLLMELSLYRT